MKKLIVTALSALICCGILTGCGNANGKSQTGQAQSGDVQELEFFQMKVEAVEHFDALIQAFEKENPGIHIVQNTVPDAETVLMTRMASNQMPDLFTQYPLAPTFREQVKENYIMDISELAGLKNVRQDIWEMAQLDGKSYALPLTLSMMGVYYNEELLAKVGAAVPTCVDELFEVCQKLLDAGITPMVFPDKDGWTVKQFVDSVSVTMLEDPTETFEKIAAGEMQAVEVEQLRTLGQLLLRLHEYAQADFMGTGYEQAIAAFANGEAAMFYQGIWAYPEISKANPELKYAMFPLYGGDFRRVGIEIDSAVAISATTKYPEAAKKFLDFLSQKENAQYFSDSDGTPSVIEGVVYNAPGFQKVYEMVLDGQGINLPSNQWPSNFGGQYASLCQRLLVEKDVEVWLNDLQALILETYAQ